MTTKEQQKRLEDAYKDIKADMKLEDFRFDSVAGGYWYVPTCLYIESVKGVNSCIRKIYWAQEHVMKKDDLVEVSVKPSDWLANADNKMTVQGSVWAPGHTRLIEGHTIERNMMVPKEELRLINTYTPPKDLAGGDGDVTPWLTHIEGLWPNADFRNYFLDYCAFMIQHPEIKCNTTIVLSGEQGIGKDAALYPLKKAIGDWNVSDIGVQDFFAPHNNWVECLMLVINEVRGGKDDFQATNFYETLKPYAAAPPEFILCNPKFVNARPVKNVMRVFITLNNINDLFIPDGDRRIFVLHSTQPQGWKTEDYFTLLFKWMDSGGCAAIQSYLRARDVSKFNPKAHAPRTEAWDAIVTSRHATGANEMLLAAVERLGTPPVFFAHELTKYSMNDGEHSAIDGDAIRGLLNGKAARHNASRIGYFKHNLKENGSPRSFPGSHAFQARCVYVRDNLLNDPDQYKALIEDRANKLANGIDILPTEFQPRARPREEGF